MDRERNRRNGNNEDESVPEWMKILGIAAGVVAGAAAVGGLIYAATRNAKAEEDSEEEESNDIRYSLPAIEQHSSRIEVVRDNPTINNLNSLLEDIYVRYVGLRQEDKPKYYKIFNTILFGLHENMKAADKYYRHYSGAVHYAGSYFDRIRIKKPDEFDMDVVISLPLNYNENPMEVEKSDIVIKPQEAGYVQLKMGQQFKEMPFKSDWETNQTAYRWADLAFYLQCSEFIYWFQGVVKRALNLFSSDNRGNHVHMVDGEEYEIRTSTAGPAITLKIRKRYPSSFKVDIDLVPVLRLPRARWPPGPGYARVPGRCRSGYWHVAPKPNKHVPPHSVDHARSWRISLHLQEHEMMYNLNNLKKSIMLIKQLRDSQDMCKIESYYIKTLALWEVECTNSNFWSNNPATLFTLFVDKLVKACEAGRIQNFWHPSNNLLDHVKPSTLFNYADRLKKLQKVLENPSDYKKVAKYLLTAEDYYEYRQKYLQ